MIVRLACLWILVIVIFLQMCHATTIIWVVSATGDYVVIATDSRMSATIRDPRFKNEKSNNNNCKVIALDDTLFYDSGAAYIGGYRMDPWDAIQVAKEVYNASEDHQAQSLSTAWINRAKMWFSRRSPSDLQAAAYFNGAIVGGGFINFDLNRNPAVFTQTLFYKDGQLSTKPGNTLKGQIGKTGIGRELSREFEEGRTPRALKAYGTLKVQDVGKNLSYDIEFVKRAVQFVIDNVDEKDRDKVHGPIDVAVIRRFGGIDWVQRKKSCYSQDLHPPKNSH